MRRTGRLGCAVAAAILAASFVAHAQGPDRKPNLVVLLMVDQMRGDYVDRLQAQWTGGLRRLVTSGAWFRQADYPYFDTVTCAGHTTVATGTLPRTHGMVMNSWWDRARGAEVPCTEDRRVTPISYGKPVTSTGDSAAAIRVSTFADELRAQMSSTSRVIAFSLKARAAIPMAGHQPDVVTWFDDSGTWVTSTAFAKTPVPAVADFIRRHPIEADFMRVWERTLPSTAYLYDDPAIGAHVAAGMTARFPHSLRGSSQAPDQAFYDRWQSSPFSDEYLADMALDVASSMRLGRTGATDMIGISFSALDKVGHDYGPESPEVQDVLIRLDRTLGRFLSELDRMVGSENYVIALSSDHGVSPIAERLTANGIDAGRIPPSKLEEAVSTTLRNRLGPGTYVSQVLNGNIYLGPGVTDRVMSDASLVDAVRRSLLAIAGVQDVLMREGIARRGSGDDPIGRSLARSYDAERSGDLFVVTKPYWTIRATGTGHGSSYGYDTRVPILLMGKGIAPGEYLAPVSPADIAPTLAFLTGVTLPYAEGRLLVEAISHRAPTATAGENSAARALIDGRR